MEEKLRLAVCQFPVSADVDANARQVARYMARAAGAGAHVVLFPETSLPGYRTAATPPADAGWWRALEDRTAAIAEAAGQLGLWVVLGSCRPGAAGLVANTLVVISEAGRVAGVYDKRRLAPREAAVYAPGEEPLVLTIKGVRCGFLICHELCHPDLFEAYRGQDVSLLFHACHNVSRAPKPLLRDLALAQLRTRAADFGVWIASANSSARHGFSTASIARPDGSVRSLKRHVAGLLVHDFPDHDLGWTYAVRRAA